MDPKAPNQRTLAPWILAARPPTLWAAVAPVLVGSALAVDDGVFRWDAFLLTMAAALLIQVGVNYANDYSDGVRGTDSADRIGPPRAVASGLITPEIMKRGIIAVFALASLFGLALAFIAGPWIIVIGVVSMAAALGYTGGPHPYGYMGLGEVFVFVFFGLVATMGTRFVYDRTVTVAALIGGVLMGFLATAILVANNIRDIETDRRSGKMTLAVKIGRSATRWLFTGLIYGSYVLVGVAALVEWVPPWTALAVISLPLAVPVVRIVTSDVTGPALIAGLKGTARLQIVFAVLFAVGAVI